MFKNFIKSIFNMEEKKASLQVGKIRQLEDGTRQVVVSMGDKAAREELAALKRQIEAANGKIAQLQKIGLADTPKDIICASGRDANGLAEVLAGKLYHSRAVFSHEIAMTQAKSIVKNTFAVADNSDEIRTPEGLNWWPVMANGKLYKYMDKICLDSKGLLQLKPEAEDEIRASFVVWADGEQAEKFIHICEMVNELNNCLPSTDFNFWHGWQYYFYLDAEKGLQMTDNWRLDMLADKAQI